MTFICNNHGYAHTHELAIEGRICYGLAPAPVRPTPAPPVADKASAKQVIYIRDLGGDMEAARAMTRSEASHYIERLKKGHKSMPQAAQTRTAAQTYDARLDMLKVLIASVPDGYFAVQAEEGAHTDFLRISRPKEHAKNFGGAIKVQTQHSDVLKTAMAFWPSGQVSVYKNSAIGMLMLLVVDWRGAALRYAKEIGRCCRCNAQLTDDRSRHYGIGPECEQHWPEIIDMVDEQTAG